MDPPVWVDTLHDAVFTDALQFKVPAMKAVVLTAGANRHVDFFHSFFDNFVHEQSLATYDSRGATTSLIGSARQRPPVR